MKFLETFFKKFLSRARDRVPHTIGDNMNRVIITGGSRGIGRAAVELFSEQGDRVAFLYRSADSAAAELADKTGAVAIKADVSDPESCKDGMEEAIAVLGGVDVLVCCAGIAYKNFFDVTSEADYCRIMETNAGGTYRCIREVIPHMVKQKYGRIITASSVWGTNGASMEGVYSASKAAVIGMTKAVAKELAPSGITVNCVAPGVIDTDMNGDLSDSDRADLAEDIPSGRFGTAKEAAAPMLFLASAEASYITAQVIGVNGGFGE